MHHDRCQEQAIALTDFLTSAETGFLNLHRFHRQPSRESQKPGFFHPGLADAVYHGMEEERQPQNRIRR